MATEHPLIRVGPDGDGGYLVPDDLADLTACFSPGVSDVSGFEADCARRGMDVFMMDATVDGPAEVNERFRFQKNMLGACNDDLFRTLPTWIDQSGVSSEGDLMLQMDIEGFEYETLIATPEEVLERFRIVVVEMHSLEQLWNAHFFRFASAAITKLLRSHACVHIHPNNATPMHRYRGVDIPPVAEFTFLRRDRFIEAQPAGDFPHPLDRDNRDQPSLILPQPWFGSMRPGS